MAIWGAWRSHQTFNSQKTPLTWNKHLFYQKS